ncbi:hypothetical protein DMX05_21620 [Pseudomonas soli]|uniref:hypothetical protein n=1 Tax=Pseudomonas soli TaxID=1306993 RepID=UPI000D90C511|nr:hypothetical protein [Pseudomonas soli]PYC35122.1 hypothetical protein DMX05_21620 [Pseudomonas soli]
MSQDQSPAMLKALDALKWAAEHHQGGSGTVEELAMLRLANSSVPFFVLEAIALIESGEAKLA